MKNSLTRSISVIILFTMAYSVYAQKAYTPYDNLPGMNKNYKPGYSNEYPSWAKMLYEYPINFNDINNAYEQYKVAKGKEKNPIIRYFKIWRRIVGPYATSDGTIILPSSDDFDRNLKAAQLGAGLQLKSASRSNADWTFLGPKQTFWLNSEGSSTAPGSCPWQVNVYSFDVSTSNPDILFCGTETGFVSRTVDAGLNWTLLAPDYPFGGGITATLIHPSNPDIVYVSGGNQVHKTIDGGATWTPLLPSNNRFYADRLKFDPTNPNKIIAASHDGVFISTNAGLSWSKKWSRPTFDIDVKPDNPKVIYAITNQHVSLDKNRFVMAVSTDGGETFTVDAAFPSTIIDKAGSLLAVTPDNPDKVLTVMLSSEGTPLLYQGNWNSGTLSWTKKATGKTNAFEMNNGQGYFDLVLEIAPDDENQILVGTTTLFKSTNGGTSFSVIGGYYGDYAIHPDCQDLRMLANGKTWLATDGGMTITNDNFSSTSNYFARNNGLIGSDMWGFDQGWNEDIVVGGRYHNGNTAITDFYQSKALRMGGAESPTGWILKGKSRHVAFNDLGSGWILPRTAEGQPEGRFTFSKYPNMDEYGSRRGNLIHHPNYYDILYVGEGNSIWRSKDAGQSYDLLHEFSNKVRYIHISYSNPKVLYADIVDQGLYRSQDGGITWQSRPALTNGSAGNSYWKGRTFFAISPYNENEIYACLSNGAWSSDIGKIFRSTDGGYTWTNWTGTVNEYTKCLAIQPTKEQVPMVYLFTNNLIGKPATVYYRTPDMTDWEKCDTNYPAGIQVNLALPFFRDSKIRAAGNAGIWESTLVQPNYTPIICPWVGKDYYNCMTDTLYFDDHSMINHDEVTWKWTIDPAPQYISNANIRNPKVVLGSPGSYDVTVQVTKDGNTYTRTIAEMVTTTTCPSIDDCSNPAELPKEDWSLVYADSEEINYPGRAAMAFDDDPSTIWHTRWSTGTDQYPHEIQVDLRERLNIHKFTYLPRQNGQNGRIKDYELYIGDSKTSWGTAVKKGTFKNNTAPQHIKFSEPVTGRYFRLKALSEVNGGEWTSIAEISITACREQTTTLAEIRETIDIKAYPIPSDGMVTIDLPTGESFAIRLYSINGKLLHSEMLEYSGTKHSLDLSNYNSGIYFIQLTNQVGTTYRIKVVKN